MKLFIIILMFLIILIAKMILTPAKEWGSLGDMDLLPGQSTSLRVHLPIMIIAHLTIMMTVIHCIGWMIHYVGMRVISGKKQTRQF